MTDLYDKEETLFTLDEAINKWMDHVTMSVEIEQIESYFDKLDYIKKFYQDNEKSILKSFEKSKKIYYHSYPFDWYLIFTPIESLAWHCIRSKGIVLYPQYPVLNYHLDFANPGLKIGLELDGAEFHDKEKDLKRDKKLRELGWTIFRISGKEMNRTHFKTFMDFEEEHEEYEKREHLRHWILETGDGVIEAIKVIYFSDQDSPFYKTDIGFNYFYYCERTLREHQLID